MAHNCEKYQRQNRNEVHFADSAAHLTERLLATKKEHHTCLVTEITLIVDANCLVFIAGEKVIHLSHAEHHILASLNIWPPTKGHSKSGSEREFVTTPDFIGILIFGNSG